MSSKLRNAESHLPEWVKAAALPVAILLVLVFGALGGWAFLTPQFGGFQRGLGLTLVVITPWLLNELTRERPPASPPRR